MALDDMAEKLTDTTTRRTIVKTGAKLAYAVPVVAATTRLSGGSAVAASPPCGGGGVCKVDQDCCAGETCIGGICSVANCEGRTCGNFAQCHATADCQCYTAPEGAGVCGCNTLCSAAPPCTSSADCGPGRFCAVNSCCGAAGVCLSICDANSTCQLGVATVDSLGVGATSSGH